MKGFLDRFFWFKIWASIVCFIIPRIFPVYSDCKPLVNFHAIEIPDLPKQKVNMIIKDLPGVSDAKLSVIFNDNHFADSLKLLKNPTTHLWQFKLVKILNLDERRYPEQFQLVCNDGGSPLKQDVTVIYRYLNTYPPSFDKERYKIDVHESTPVHTIVFPLSDKITDKDYWPESETKYNYSLTPKIPEFVIGLKDGVITLRKALDYDNNTRNYTFTLLVQDLGNNQAENVGKTISTTLEIAVINDDDLNPKFIERFFHVVIFANVTLESTYKIEPTPKAIDGDKLTDKIDYKLIDTPSGFDNYFQFLPGTMEIKLKTSLDQIPSTTFQVTIKTFQVDRPTDRYDIGFLVLHVYGLSTSSPIMTKKLYEVSVRENALPSTILLQVKAKDKDGDALEYKMDPQIEEISLNSSNGLVTLGKPIDSTNGTIKFQVWAQEINTAQKYSSQHSNVIIRVVDENDHSPKFSSTAFLFVINQSAVIGTEVGSVHATDEDPGINGDIIYNLSGNPSSFTIDSGGKIKTTESLKAQKVDKYKFMVTAKDKAAKNSRSTSAFVEVNITKENLFEPKFSKDMAAEINISESAPQGTFVRDIYATDDDFDKLIFTVRPDDTFGIKSTPNSGCSFLYLKKELDVEHISSYNLQITASDTIHNTTTLVNVTVHGENDIYPAFKQTEYTFYVEEHRPKLSFVGHVNATDGDINPSESITYSIPGSNSDFQIDRENGAIYTRRMFSILEPTLLTFAVYASDNGHPKALNTSCLVKIHMVDINNHIPEFGLQAVQLIVQENNMKDRIYRLEATDKDFDPKFTIISYEIIDGPFSTFFELKNETDLYLTSGNEKVLGKTVSVIVETFNEDRRNRTNSINITVTFKDINNKVPRVGKMEHSMSIYENRSVGSTIVTIDAQDDDVEEENKLTEFTIVDWSQENPFFINANTGAISLWKTLDADGTQKNFSFKIRAQNVKKMDPSYNGQEFTEAQVLINLINVNDNPPKFNQNIYFFQVEETAPLNQALFQISASDLDNDAITYSLAGDSNPFIVDKLTGNISLSKTLNYEEKSMHNFSVIARDNGQPQKSASADVVVLVKNMNNKSPIVNDKMTFSVREGQPKGTLIGYIYASDPDGDNLLYSTDSTDVSVNSSTGELKSQIVFDYENQKQYKLLVQVSDELHKTNVAVTIDVVDINDNNPQFNQTKYETNLTNLNKGSSVIKLLATDGDEYDIINYSLIGDSDFDIHPNGEIFLIKNLDWVTKENVITLMASATDQKNSTTSVLVSIYLVKPLDFAQNLFTASISEAAPLGSTVLQFDPCDFVDRTVNIHNLAIVLSDKSFVVYDEKCGCIRTKALFDREKKELYNVTMAVKDRYRTHQANLQIHIEDYNDEAPILDPVKETIILSDDCDPGSFIIEMNATDKDKNDGFTYLLKETYGKFMIDTNNGVIRSCGRFNYRLDPEYNLTVVVIDHGSPPLESNQTFTIKITNGNRHQPMFQEPLFTFKVNESTAAGHLIGRVNATDEDNGANGDLNFQIIDGNKNHAFAIGKLNGTVWVNNSKALDYERTKIFNLTVEANDSGRNPKSNTVFVLISLEDINDHFPEFKSADFVSVHLPISENKVVFVVRAMDADSNKNGYNKIEYSQLNMGDIFVTDPSSGEVRTTSKLTNVKMYSINFQACDKGGNCANQTVKLLTYSNVPDIIRVDEGIQNAFVTDVNATDNDFGVFYSLISCNEYFTINSTTGIIQTKKPLVWHPENNNIPITIQVHYSNNENNQTEIKINVQVIDVNDHAPEFSQTSYILEITENAKETFHIQATDMDDGENALITYNFFPSEPQVAEGSISLNTKTGTLNVSLLDREDQAQVTFSIMAMDNGQPPRNSTVEVVINLLDDNDNAPIFKPDEYKGKVAENSEPQKILTVHADDADSDLNGFLYYELQDKSVPFSINEITGDIWSMGGLDFEKNSEYNLQVMAFDQGMNPKNSSCSVSISILDICDEVPQLTAIISLSKQRNIPGTSVFSLKSSSNGTNYNISAEDNIVDINEKTGNVITSSQISKTDTNYHLSVTAWNHCNLPVFTKFEIKPEDDLPKTSGKDLKAEITENQCSKESLFNLSSLQEYQGHAVSFILETFNDFFKIENGQIYCQHAVDREKNSEFELLVLVNFKNSPVAYIADETLKIVVTVNDINDHSPEFQPPSLFYSVPSTAHFFYRVERIKVTDEDVGENGASQFSLTEGDKDLFYINPSSGELHILFDAAHSEKSEFNLQVMAVDQNGKGRAAKAPLKVTIYDNQFNLEMNVNKPVDFVEKILDSFIGNLSGILGFEIVVDQVQVHQNSDKHSDLRRSDILFHALDLINKKLVSEEMVDGRMKTKKAEIENLLKQFGMQAGQVQHVFVKEVKQKHKISNSEIIIIVLACIIFVGCVCGIIMAIMRRQQQNKIKDLKSSMKTISDNPMEVVNSAFNYADIYNGSEISDDTASRNRQNGDLSNQHHAEDNQSFQDGPKGHGSETCSTNDGHPILSNTNHEHMKNNGLSSFSKTGVETSETNMVENVNSLQTIPTPPPTSNSLITKLDSPADINPTSDTSDSCPESSVVLDSGVVTTNQHSDLDTDDVIIQIGSKNALDAEQHSDNETNSKNVFPLLLHDINDHENITEL